jgi:hypothetical protein
MINEHEAVGGRRTCRRNQSTQRKSAAMPLCPPQIPHNLTLHQTWAIMIGSQQLAWPLHVIGNRACKGDYAIGTLRIQSKRKN